MPSRFVFVSFAYIRQVNEAMLAGRASVYENDYYLSATYPPALSSDVMLLTPARRASLSIMHVFIQCPRLNCLVRQAILHPEDSAILAAAVTLTEYMWQLNLPTQISELLQTSVTTVDQPPYAELADILFKSLHFDSVQNMILCTRYWMLQNILCGLTDTLYRHFPSKVALSLLPDQASIQIIDRDAGICLAESLAWAESVSQKLPLVPLRLHTPLQISIGPWHRTVRNCTSSISPEARSHEGLDQQTSVRVSQAVRMRNWLIYECNRIHKQWDVSTVDEKSLYEALDSMAGEQIPDWLPTRVRFEAEDGDMVIKLDYEKPTANSQDRFSLNGSDKSGRWMGGREVFATGQLDIQNSMHNAGAPLTFASVEEAVIPESAQPPSSGPSDFLFKSGRNLCSTSGWWPTSDTPTISSTNLTVEGASAIGPCAVSSGWPQAPRTSVVLLDSTHKTSAFQPKAKRTQANTTVTFNNRNVNGCMSPAWTSGSGSVKSSNTSNNGKDGSYTSTE